MPVPAEVTDLIQTSGNNFHAKVARWLVKAGWSIDISPYYMDQTQNKAREIDLIAEKVFFNRGWNTVYRVVVRLFIECKFITANNVFWLVDKDKLAAANLVCSGGLFQKNNIFTQEHHYLSTSPRVAKLFTSAKPRPNYDNEPIYKALNQVLNATVSMRNRSISIPSGGSQNMPTRVLEFPVVVCNSFDQFYSVDFHNDSEPELIQDNFQLEVSYAYIDRHEKRQEDFFLLDFVAFDKITEFAAALDKDASNALLLMSD